MTSSNLTSASAQNAIMAGTATASSGNWRIEAQKTLSTIERLQETFRSKVSDFDKMKRDKPKAKFIREKRAPRKAGRDLRLARNSFDEQIQTEAKALCRPLCETAYDRLPEELRDAIVRHLIDEKSATFLSDKDDKVSFANGASTLQHAFDEEYTGIGLHTDIIEMLVSMGARFDFRACHELLDKVFAHYASAEYGSINLPSKIKRLSLVVMECHLKDREAVLAHLERLTRLGKGANIYIIIETSRGTQAQVIRRVRRVLRMVFPLLKRLHELDIRIHVVVNPAYTTSKVRNSSGVTFSIPHDGPLRYEMSPENATFTVEGFENRLRERFQEYGERWDSRFPPRV